MSADTENPITIAIPFHRGLDYLGKAVESVRAQTDGDWRLIVCDDGGVEKGVREFVAGIGDSRIAYILNEKNLGMVGNWNRQFELAETDLIALLHQDDCLLPNYVSTMRRLAATHPDVAAFYCGTTIIDDEGRECFSFADWIKRHFVPGSDEHTELDGRDAVRALIRGNFIMCPTLCYRRSLLGQLRFDARWKQVQDLEFTTRLLMSGLKMLGTSERGYAYRRHSTSATSLQSESLLRFEEERQLFDLLADECAARGWTDAAIDARRKRIVRLHLMYRITGDVLHLRGGPARSKWRFLRGM